MDVVAVVVVAVVVVIIVTDEYGIIYRTIDVERKNNQDVFKLEVFLHWKAVVYLSNTHALSFFLYRSIYRIHQSHFTLSSVGVTVFTYLHDYRRLSFPRAPLTQDLARQVMQIQWTKSTGTSNSSL